MSTTKTWAQVARHTESEPIMNTNTELIESIIDINDISTFPDIKNNIPTNTLLVSKESITEVTDITELIKIMNNLIVGLIKPMVSSKAPTTTIGNEDIKIRLYRLFVSIKKKY